MADYVLLFSGGSMPETEAAQAAVMQAWGAWYEGLGAAVKDGGNPFTPAVKRIAADGTVSGRLIQGPLRRDARTVERPAGFPRGRAPTNG